MKRKFVIVISFLMLFLFACSKRTQINTNMEKIKLKVLILNAFELGNMYGDVAGEAQFYYEEYFMHSKEYDIVGEPMGSKLYVENDMGLFLIREGKPCSAINLTALLCDQRFDFSDTYFILAGCAGGSKGYAVAGDVVVVTNACDFELGHSVSQYDKENADDPDWYHVFDYDEIANYELNQNLINRVYELTKDIKLNTTEKTKLSMIRNFNNEEWAIRDPKVIKGTSLTADNYWKGEYDHNKANYISKFYNAKSPYAATIMEDTSVCLTLKKFGHFDKLIILRDVVDMDVYIEGQTPSTLFGDGIIVNDDSYDGFEDLFPVAMENNFKVGKVVIEDLLKNG